ncbi:MAG: excinuclease ABC subunit UvrA [Actinomycetota bacterium]|nr:excinuclease ABC subunit UvrA [Actinomycetota bacterium]
MASNNDIQVIGARENNLKGVTLSIPKGKLVAFAGVSGSGKSSLAFDTIARESARQWQASYPLFLRNKMPHYERPHADELRNLTPAIVVDQKPLGAGARSTVGTAVDVAPLLRLLFSRCGDPSAGGSMAYSFNHPAGACPECTGLGTSMVLDEESLFDLDKSIAEGGILFSQFSSGWQTYLYQANELLDPGKPLHDFTEEEWHTLRYGAPRPIKVQIRSNNTGRVDTVDYEGVIPRFKRLYLNRDISKLKKGLQEEILTHVHHGPCEACGGSGLNPDALASKVAGHNIVEMMDMPVSELVDVLGGLTDPRGASLARQTCAYLRRMVDVGIGYLSLSRRSDTLSGGEAQRIKIVRNLGSSLSDITYVFDEPTAGLHPADAERIGRLLVGLRDAHNNVLVVEHSRQMLELADHIVEMGPGAGGNGGEVVYEGDLAGLVAADTPTARALDAQVAVKGNPRPWTEGFEIRDACCHNLKHVDVTIPKGVFTCITGVAGSGKSSLMRHEFPTRFPDTVVVDQKPIGTSVRSTPATYTGAMDEIRKLFAKENGVTASWFSFNSKGGCPICKGKGTVSYEMAFAEPVEVVCEECQGRRYNPTALDYTLHGKNIEEVLALTVDEAIGFFEDDAKVCAKLLPMREVGLGYLTLGQPTSTCSGGEIQRIKLSSELGKRGNVYVLDEPSIGLHAQDVEVLASLLDHLVDAGNTVVCIEHRMELVAQADWVIDLGPEGGSAGGEVVFTGTPAQLMGYEASKTGRYLREVAETA